MDGMDEAKTISLRLHRGITMDYLDLVAESNFMENSICLQGIT